MKEEPESVQSPASAVSGDGPQAAAPPSTKLGIGIGAAAVKEERRQLTAEQRDELQRQVVIYKYIAAGVPIPSGLVRPIWKTVDKSLGFPNGADGIHKQYPSFVGFSKDFDYVNMMDPEPNRCRRTDGKKWRCRKTVVTGQKYCPQHMHRGRGRSRKPVESCETSNAHPTNQLTKNSENLNTTCLNSSSATTKDSSVISRSNGEFKIMGAKLNPMVSSAKTMSLSLIKKGTLGLVNAAAVMNTCTVPTDSTVTTATVVADKGSGNDFYKVACVDDSNRNSSTNAGFKDQMDRANACRNLNNANVCTSQKLNFSPKSVLRGSVYLVKTQDEGGNSGFLSLDIEPGRCRRTDGKKWRCRRDVVPDEKYCPAHMHRGAKRQVVAYPSSLAPHTTISSGLHSNAVLANNVHTSNLDTNLSISIAPNHQLQAKDGKNPSGDGNTANSSSSDTISDTIVANCDYRDVTS